MRSNTVGGWPLPWLVGALGVSLVVLVAAIAIASGLVQLGGAPGASPSPSPTNAAGASPSPTLSPTQTPAPSFSPSPTPSAGPTDTSPPPPSPIAEPSPTTAPTASSSAAPTAAPQSRFREVAGFPAPGEIVLDIVPGGPGFVAVGYVDTPTADCAYRQDARIWTSPDGETWTRRDGDGLTDARLSNVILRAGLLYAFGYAGHDECPDARRDDFGNNVWRSADGIVWEQITHGLRYHSPYDRWSDVALAGDTFIGVGTRPRDDETPRAGVWTSGDAIEWTYATRAPRTYELVSVAARGSTVVAWGSDLSDGLAWYSSDAGATWRRGSLAGGYVPYDVDLVAGNGQFVAFTNSCCEEPNVTVGLEYVSSDGITWTPGPSYRRRSEGGVVTPGGVFVALTDSPETRISTTGADWRSGPPGPALDANHFRTTAAAAGPLGVITTIVRGVDHERRVQAFLAPLSEFDPAAWASFPEPSLKMVMGQRYRYALYTHCGMAGMRVVMDGSTWIADEIVSGPFRDPGDLGTVTKTGPDTARYENRRGALVLLSRAHPPPPWPACA